MNDTPIIAPYSAERVTGRERRRRYTAEHKLQLVEETMRPGMTVSAVARLHGVSRPHFEGGDLAGRRRGDVGLHLHRFQNQ